MAIDLQGLDALGFTQLNAFNAVNNNSVPLFAWVDFKNKTLLTTERQTFVAGEIFKEIKEHGSVENCGGVKSLARRHIVPVSWVEQITDAIFLVVEQIKNGATPTEG